MTAEDFRALEAMIDRKLESLRGDLALVHAHDDDIRAVKAVLGFLVAVGAIVLVLAGAVQGWFAWVDHLTRK